MAKTNKFLFLLLSFFFSGITLSQAVICLGDSYEGCMGEPVTLEICDQSGNGGLNTGVYQMINPQKFYLSDDQFSPIIDLGFDFKFFGISYNQILVSSNGFITFDVSTPSGFSPWSVVDIPATTNGARNSIMACWEDLYPPLGNKPIYFEVLGAAPNRVAVIFWDGLSKFSSSCQIPELCYTGGIVLFEGTNRIETHISNKTVCTSWGGGRAVHGLNNAEGTVAYPVDGRNNTIFNLQNDGKLFQPDGNNGYIIEDIPFSILSSVDNPNLVWNDTEGHSYPYNDGVLDITIQSTDTVGYFLASSTCGVGVGSVSDTTWIVGLTSSVDATAEDDFCSAGMGSVSAIPTGGVPPYLFDWVDLGNSSSQTVEGVFSGIYTVSMTDGNGCVSTATVVVGDIPASYPTSFTPVSCFGTNDGTATVTMEPEIGNVTYQWNDSATQTTSTAVGLSAGTYQCVVTSDTGCSMTVSVIVEETPPLAISIVEHEDISCFGSDNGLISIEVVNGTPPYSYDWSTSNSSENIASDLPVGTTLITVTDVNGCTTSIDAMITEPEPLAFSFISNDTIVCIGDSLLLTATGDGGSSAYIYEWYVGDNIVGNGESVYVSSLSAQTEYCVHLSEECGSGEVMSCVMVGTPEPVDISILPDVTGGCHPIEVEFQNTSDTLNQDIDYTIWRFGDGTIDTVAFVQPTTHEFGEGSFTLQVVVVTADGCHYIEDFPNLIQGYSYPNADFSITPNPASMYNPEITASDQTIGDVAFYTWYAEEASPGYSTQPNPRFVFPNEVGSYPLTLVVKNKYGCLDTIVKTVRIESEVTLFAPNAFTPDANGFNDTWRVYIQGIDVYDYRLQIYNRWGELLFESLDPGFSWDGSYGYQLVEQGTYVWKIWTTDRGNDKKYEFTGSVTVIR